MTPTLVQVNKRLKDEPEARHAEFTWDFPDTVQEALEKYGESLTLRFIKESITLNLQAPARKVLEASPPGLTNEEYSSTVSDVMANHKLEVKRSRGSSTPKISAYQQMAQDLSDPTKRDAIIERFRSLGFNLEATNGPEASSEEASAARRRR